MTPELLELHVEESIAKALRHESWIDKEILNINGFSTGVMRRLINNLCRLPKRNPTYLEVGLYCGATFCAAGNNNPELYCFGMEDFSQDFGEPDVMGKLADGLAKFFNGNYRVACGDFFGMALNEIDQEIDIFFYDGSHDYESQRKALGTILDKLSPLSLFIVDDYNWRNVHAGTAQSFADLGDRVKINREWILRGPGGRNDDPIWHNGIAIFSLSRKKIDQKQALA